ncbi:MAG: hypothetical protein ACYTFG_09595, partial [Planctomycetota bacterium]
MRRGLLYALHLPLLALLAALGCAHGTPSPSTFEVVSFSPVDGATAVETGTTIQVTFTAEPASQSVVGTHNILVVNSNNHVLEADLTVSGTQ